MATRAGTTGGAMEESVLRFGIASGIFFAVFLLGMLLTPLIVNFLLA